MSQIKTNKYLSISLSHISVAIYCLVPVPYSYHTQNDHSHTNAVFLLFRHLFKREMEVSNSRRGSIERRMIRFLRTMRSKCFQKSSERDWNLSWSHYMLNSYRLQAQNQIEWPNFRQNVMSASPEDLFHHWKFAILDDDLCLRRTFLLIARNISIVQMNQIQMSLSKIRDSHPIQLDHHYLWYWQQVFHSFTSAHRHISH